MSAIGPSRKTGRTESDVSAPEAIGRALQEANTALRAENAQLRAAHDAVQTQLSAERAQCISKVQFYKGKLEETRELVKQYHTLLQ